MNSTIKIVLFLALIYFSTQQGFQCSVNNCSVCSYPNVCGLCQNNFVLTLNSSSGSFYCNPVTCPPNCNTCYQNNICQVCSQNFTITLNGTCVSNTSSNTTLPLNCLAGINNMTCQLCSYGYSLQAGFCYPTISMTPADQNCWVKMTSTICQICQSGYVVSFMGNCILNQFNNTCTQSNCSYCQNSTGKCLLCNPNYQLTSMGTCVSSPCPNINGCSLCTNSTQCQTCLPGYILSTNNQTCQLIGYGCNISWCATCSNSQSCGKCQTGYQLVPFQTGSNTVYLCTQILCPFNVTNCLACTQNYNSVFQYNQVLCAPNSCAPNYINVHGYCIANISGPIHCDLTKVTNCVSCSTSNFCGQCQAGYTLTRYGACIPTVCNVQNCQLCSINNICQQCNANYILTIGNLSLFNSSSNYLNFFMYLNTQQCTLNTSITCIISNCQYCLTSGICSMCMQGYTLSSNNMSCVQTCNVMNCYQCNNTTVNITNNTCIYCMPGYTLSLNGMNCVLKNFSCSTQCSNNSCVYNWNTNSGQCIQCSSNMILYNGQCFSSTCNIYGCDICAPWAAPNTLCLKCQQSLLLNDGYCVTSNCQNGVSNCVNCIESGLCLGCKQGYYLKNLTNGTNICVSAVSISNCTVDNCLTCQSGNPGICQTCALPYIPNAAGQCVCKFQNCLDCSTSSFACNLCPPPLFASMQQAECVPQPSLNNNCTLQNCQYCFADNQCAVCAVGYQLDRINYICKQNNCTNGLNHCQLCDQFSYECQLCQPGYMINNFLQGGSCYPINQGYTCNISGCAVCSSTNNSVCIACLPTYQLNTNSSTYCTAYSCNISNCYICLANNFCTLCLEGYYLANNMQCMPKFSQIVNCQGSINYCDICVSGLYNPSSSSNYCIKCMNGFQYNTVLGQCLPQQNSIPNCLVQIPNYGLNNLPSCLVCQQGWFVNAFGMCSSYVPQPTNSNCTVYNCMYCGFNNSTCSFCFMPWGISSTGMCLTNASNICGNNCVSCLNSTLCVTCVSTYLPYNGLCISCNIAGCTQCQSAGTCSTCRSGYQLTNSLCIACNIPGCKTCSNNNICSVCNITGMVPNSLGNQCVMCNVANCTSCISNNVCGLCYSGYQLSSSINATITTQCVLCSVTNCQSCSSNNVCSSCLNGYSLVNQTCILCQYPCATCNSNISCTTCIQPAFLQYPSSNGSCTPATIANCIQYSNTTTTCIQCINNYYYNSTLNLCVYQCNNTCQSCNLSNTNQCTSCMPGYYLTVNNTCLPCQSSGCTTCNSSNTTQCLNCNKGFYLSNSECKLCPGYCASCQTYQMCTQLINTNFQTLVTINSTTYLAVCSQGCVTCSTLNPQICSQCANGLYLNSQGVCQLCNENCMTCSSTNSNICLSCYPNSYLSGTICIVCSSNCQTCLMNNTSICQSCYPGFYLNQNNTCIQGCSINCQTCSSTNICTQCSSSYTLFSTIINNSSSTVCVQCSTNCRTCAQNSPSVCVTCGTGFYLSGTNCTACSPNCGVCGFAGCSQCIQGYFLNSGLSCSINCQFPCATCSANIPTKCSSCIAGYTYSSITNTCSQQISCAGACTVCPMGYILISGICTQCNTTNCQQCNSSNLNQCFTCSPGYFLNSNQQCQTCISSCATCLRGDGCTSCASGYTYNSLIEIQPSGYQCMSCQYPCATCQNSISYCTSCVSGYTITGWKCTQTFYFGFIMTLNTNLTIFNQNYYTFITTLAQAIGSSNPNVVTIVNVVKGSVIVNGQVAPTSLSGTQQSNQQFYDLDSTLSGSIANMPITSIQLSVVGGTIDYSTVDLGLILGICIPVGVLIIAGIALYLYRKNKTRSIVIERKIQNDEKYNNRQSFELSGSYKQAENSSRPL